MPAKPADAKAEAEGKKADAKVENRADVKPAAKAENKADVKPAANEKGNDAAKTAAAAEFTKIFAEWKSLIGELASLQLSYRSANDDQRLEIQAPVERVDRQGG